jgi:hypothetical protein
MNNSIFIFYHIYAIGDWENLVNKQLVRLKNSGVYGSCLAMFVSFIGDEKSVEKYYEIIKTYKKIHTIKADNINNKEYDILHAIWFLANETFPCRENAGVEARVLYFHTKGVSSGLTSLEVQNRMNDWRNMMEHFVIDNWSRCFIELDTADVVGCNYRKQDLFGVECGHFSGNFWWARLSYIYKLSEPKKDWDVAYNEFWIGEKDPQVKILHESKIDHYKESYSSEKYL